MNEPSSQENPNEVGEKKIYEEAISNSKLVYRGCLSNIGTGRLYDIDILQSTTSPEMWFRISHGREDDQYISLKHTFEVALNDLNNKLEKV